MDREREANRVVWVGADHMELTLAPGSEKGKKQVGGAGRRAAEEIRS